jgi:hypothetical protein
MGITEAFIQAGAPLKNNRWSWSACSPDGTFVVLTLWGDLINYKTKPITYDNFQHEDLSKWVDALGNKERIEVLKFCRDRCDGLFRVVITIAKDVSQHPRQIEDAHYKSGMTMRLLDFNEATGEFKAVHVT